MKRFLLVLSAVALCISSVGLFVSSSASAASPFDDTIQLTDKLLLKDGGNGGEIDLSTTFLSMFDDAPQVCKDARAAFTAGLSADNIRWAYGTWDGGGANTSIPFLVWSTDFSKPQFYDYGNATVYAGEGNFQGGSLRIERFNNTFYYACSENEWVNTVLSSSDRSTLLYLSTFEVEYPSGYQGEEIPDTAKIKSVPEFGYNVLNRKLTVHYLRNIDLNNQFKWKYTIYEAGTEFEKGEQFTSSTLDFFAPYSYQFEPNGSEDGNYILEIDLVVPIPYVPPEDVVTHLSMQLLVSGEFFIGTTLTDNCTNGVCTYTPPPCAALYTDIFARMNCELQRALNFGLINPSINAFKALITGFTVPNTPTCNIPLSNVRIDQNHVFPLSTYSQQACVRAEEVREEFPILAIFLNFTLAFFTFWMVVRIINRLTDNTKNDVIEGV